VSGFSVDVETWYVEKESVPEDGRYVFGYTITIANAGDLPGQLLRRHWIITDGSGHVEEVRGPGVVGEQPRIEPGQAFRYSSGAVIETPVGVMQGSYEFVRDDATPFSVAIPAFSLSVPNMVH
tara:strand:- start:2229 stop:2597 length:369 start_codon:yes stop_codon:yes gene_type:complete